MNSKNKKTVIFTLLFAGFISLFTSCEDKDTYRFPELSNGAFIKFVTQPFSWEGLAIIDGISIVKYHIGTDIPNASFVALTEDPSNNVSSYQLFVRGTFDGASEDPIPYKSTTTFPFDVSFTTQDMATLFNVPIETFQTGDEFIFTSITTLEDGTVYNSNTSACEECPTTVLDEDGNPLGAGNWNGGTIDGVILQGGDTGTNDLLPAIYWTVRYLEPTS